MPRLGVFDVDPTLSDQFITSFSSTGLCDLTFDFDHVKFDHIKLKYCDYTYLFVLIVMAVAGLKTCYN